MRAARFKYLATARAATGKKRVRERGAAAETTAGRDPDAHRDLSRARTNERAQ